MTELLDKAIKRVHSFLPEARDDFARVNRAEVVHAQSTWNAYTNAVCGTIAQREERNGANGAGMVVEMMACFIRHSVARLNELTR